MRIRLIADFPFRYTIFNRHLSFLAAAIVFSFTGSRINARDNSIKNERFSTAHIRSQQLPQSDARGRESNIEAHKYEINERKSGYLFVSKNNATFTSNDRPAAVATLHELRERRRSLVSIYGAVDLATY